MSLSNQLKKIASNNPFKQALLHQRQRPSLLFDGKQAADIDLDTIYAMGINGLLELKTFDARFDEFEQTLFSESMKSFDRTRKVKLFFSATGSSSLTLIHVDTRRKQKT